MPELSALEVFLAVARTASLGAAGRELGLTQQAVSARLTSIEAQTGVRLAVRTVRGTQLTPAGVVVAQWANKLLDVAQQVDAGLGSLRTESRSKGCCPCQLTNLCCGCRSRRNTDPGGRRCTGGRCSGTGAGSAMPPHSRRGSSGECFTRRAVGDLGP
jgi:DNA-binding transcriptional LysR family regulator